MNFRLSVIFLIGLGFLNTAVAQEVDSRIIDSTNFKLILALNSFEGNTNNIARVDVLSKNGKVIGTGTLTCEGQSYPSLLYYQHIDYKFDKAGACTIALTTLVKKLKVDMTVGIDPVAGPRVKTLKIAD